MNTAAAAAAAEPTNGGNDGNGNASQKSSGLESVFSVVGRVLGMVLVVV